MLTTIPTEPGWNIKVDGKKVEPVEILKAFIGIELEPGTHTVTMKYTPPGFNLGIITLILGIAIIVLIYLKSDKAIYAQLTEKKKKLFESLMGLKSFFLIRKLVDSAKKQVCSSRLQIRGIRLESKIKIVNFLLKFPKFLDRLAKHLPLVKVIKNFILKRKKFL